MKMYEEQINTYVALNKLVSERGTVLFGGTKDKDIPILDLKQSFSFEENIYNRSFSGLSIYDACEVFAACIEELVPESVLLHIGEADTECLEKDLAAFDKAYRNLITYIKKVNRKCIISVIPLKNREQSAVVSELNSHLKLIAESEQCYFCDINTNYVWNPKAIREVISFLSSTGFVRPLRRAAPNYDLIKVLFCFNDHPDVQQVAAYEEEERGEQAVHSEEPIAGML